jgi:hypothetical protein
LHGNGPAIAYPFQDLLRSFEIPASGAAFGVEKKMSRQERVKVTPQIKALQPQARWKRSATRYKKSAPYISTLQRARTRITPTSTRSPTK